MPIPPLRASFATVKKPGALFPYAIARVMDMPSPGLAGDAVVVPVDPVPIAGINIK